MQPGGNNIVIVGPAYPFRGGIADTNEAMARAFQRAGYRVSLVTFLAQYPEALFPGKTQYSNDPKPEDLEIHRWIHAYYPLNWWKAADKIKALRPDVVIVRYWQPFMAPCLGSISLLLRGAGLRVVGLTDNVIPHEKSMTDSLLTGYFMRSCTAFMALSRAVENDLKSLTEKPTTFFPHPINDRLGNIESKEQARTALGLDVQEHYLLFFGIVRKYKGLDLLLQAMAKDEVKALGLKLIIAGEFYENASEYERLIDALGLRASTIVKNEFISAEEVPHYFCAADLVVQTYRSATQSGITQMALHFDIPVLVTRVGGLDEFVTEGKTGLFAQPEPTDIARVICAFFEQDPQPFVEAIKVEKKRFSWDTFVEHFRSFITALN